MIAAAPSTRLPAAANCLVLYHVVHPADMEKDEWTQHYDRALAICARFVRDYGEVHLHAETHPAGQYDAECLMRTGAEE